MAKMDRRGIRVGYAVGYSDAHTDIRDAIEQEAARATPEITKACKETAAGPGGYNSGAGDVAEQAAKVACDAMAERLIKAAREAGA